uniref:Carboxylic ester hydrolase n=1 Tax=Clastoptera arizonana TaxID=38151 RepID=A0A1B6CWJ1_9HEMI
MELKQISFCVKLIFIYNLVSLFQCSSALLVNTTQGTVQGSKDFVNAYFLTSDPIIAKPFYKFLGIPYAQPPIGALRFKPPQPPLKWSGVRNAWMAKDVCVQGFPTIRGSEDCLYINVYTPNLPANGKPLKPVMFWIYGGSFQTGDGILIYGPDYLVAKDVVVVTFNYRLNSLGFLSLGNNLISGNVGLKDQVEALRWVKQNIANFGGDPNRVTIFGESAGAASVEYLILSPSASGLFQQAIVQSGSALSPWAFTRSPKENAFKLAEVLGRNFTNETELYNFLMAQPAYELTRGASKITSDAADNFRSETFSFFVPCAEDENGDKPFITKPPEEYLLKGNFNKVPMIFGTLDGEGIVVPSAVKLTREKFEVLNNYSDWAAPLSWRIESPEERSRVGQIVKDYFFNGSQVSWDSISSFVSVYTSLFYTIEGSRAINAYVKYSDKPFYNYEITHQPVRSPLKLFAVATQGRIVDFKAAAHADDVPLIFRPYFLEIIFFPYKDQVVSQRMTNMWTNFAKTGNPNYPGIKVTWNKLSNDSRSYLEIGSDLQIRNGKVQGNTVQFFDTLCKSLTLSNYTCSF